MKNLNKFTKAELITKLQNSNTKISNNSKLIKIVEYIIFFKSLIIKFTLIALLIRWFKKYSLLKKLWHIFRWIASTLLGISIIDIYSLDIINWIKETNLYRWYLEFFNIKENSQSTTTKEENGRFNFPRRIEKQTDEIQKENIRISEWFNRNNDKEEIIEEEKFIDKINYKTILIISGVIIISSLTWYYFDEVKDGLGTSIEWIKNIFSRPSSGPNTGNTDPDIAPTTQNSRESFQKRFWRIISRESEDNNNKLKLDLKEKGKLIPEFIEDEEIELIDRKGKQVLTSPSLESLNNKASEAWSETSSNSPKSDTSSSTITPDNFKPESSSSLCISPTIISELRKYWKSSLPEDTIKNINFIENAFNYNIELEEQTGDKMMQNLYDIIASHDAQVDLYYSEKISEWTLDEKNHLKIAIYYFKEWISKYHEMILPNETKLEVGNITNEPNKLFEWFKNN